MAKHKKNPNKKKPAKQAPKKKQFAAPWWKDKNSLAALLLVLLLSFVTLFPTLQNDFTNWDDPDYVIENQYITSLDAAHIKDMFSKNIAYNYHPLTILTLAIDYQMADRDPKTGKLDAAPFHRTNLLLHLFNIVLVFWLMLMLGLRKEGALLAALLFGIHPMHVESVAWVAERKDVLYGLFFLGGLIAYAKYLKAGRPLKFLGLALLLFVLSCLSKPTAVVFPVVLLLVDFYRERKWDMRVILEKTPFFLVSILFGLKTVGIQSVGAVGGVSLHSLGERIMFVGYGIAAYVGKVFAPFGLSTFHPFPYKGDFPPIFYIAPFITLCLFALVAYSLKKTRMVAFGFLFFLVVNALTLQFITVGTSVISERYTYIPYVGLFFMVGFGIDFLLKNKSPGHHGVKRIVFPVVGIYCMLFMYLSFQQAKTWKNSLTLWTQVRDVYPDDSVPYDKIGNYYLDEERDLPKAIENLNLAVQRPMRVPSPYVSRAKYFLETNEFEKAKEDCINALKIVGNDITALNICGNTSLSLGNFGKALEYYERILQQRPDDFRSLANIGAVYFKQNKLELAIDFFDKSLAINPNFAHSYLNRAVSNSRLKQYKKAIPDYGKVLELEPDHPKANIWRAQDLYNIQDYRASLKDYNIAIEKDPKSVNMRRGRARVHRAMGNEAAAVADEGMADKLKANSK